VTRPPAKIAAEGPIGGVICSSFAHYRAVKGLLPGEPLAERRILPGLLHRSTEGLVRGIRAVGPVTLQNKFLPLRCS
jgi:hypothetical protein